MKKLYPILLLLILSSCNVSDRLSRVGKAPEFNSIDTYDEEIVNGAMRKKHESESNKLAQAKESNSLWRPGSRTFFRDQRARAIGDILKVQVAIADNAKLDNNTETKRNDNMKTGVPNLLGYEADFSKVLPQNVNPANLIGINSSDNNKGQATIDRKESIKTTIAATVIEILPSNNLVIKGSQEIKVNYEVREVTIHGIVRPEDISAQNTVSLDQVAEARVTYGGRGNLSDYQQPRFGKQILDIISPF